MLIEIPGDPIPKARHRTSMRNGYVHQYDPQEKEKNHVKDFLRNSIINALTSKNNEIAVEASNLAQNDTFDVDLTFHIPYKRSLTVGPLNRVLWGFNECNQKPDLDNLAKFYLDCANGILYPDDKLISNLTVKKFYSTNSKTVLTITGRKLMNLDRKAEKILELINPSSFQSLTQDLHEILEFSNSCSQEELHLLKNSNPSLYRQKLNASAYLLSKLADNYSILLTKIHRNAPNLHKELNCKADLQEIPFSFGKPLC